MESKVKNAPVEHLYSNRETFSIIGLTGLAGSGCSTLAQIIANKKFVSDGNSVRKPEDIYFDCSTSCTNANPEEETANIESTSQLVFKRKYTICYNFIQKKYKEYKIIKYTRVVLLYTFLYAIEKMGVDSAEKLKQQFYLMMADKFFPSHNEKRDIEFKLKMGYKDKKPIDVNSILDKLEWNSLWVSLNEISTGNYIQSLEDEKKVDYVIITDFFFENKVFNNFAQAFVTELSKKDYYCLCFMFHRLTACIRNWGDPFMKSQDNYDNLNKNYDHLYDIVKLINYIIKGTHRNTNEQDCSRRIVIDSIRNSMEALYLRERYTAFYMIAVHDDDNRAEHFKEKVSKSVAPTLIKQEIESEKINLMHACLMYLMNIETENGDFEEGKFHSPNVGQCIADAEIHISNVTEVKLNATTFYTMAEQWMKYAALILHPGLITPSAEERCMIVAYSAKFNSGCLSRQVGACITNQYHSIRTIGWNDVPYGQIPCSLRELGDIKEPSKISRCYYPYMYSRFEQGGQNVYDSNRYNFKQKVDEDFSDIDSMKDTLNGLPLSFCFKTLQNRYEGEKNQVYTRSLHAEENAMLQMVKFGGEPLMNGIIYVTASPCELCSKKLYQIGVRKIVYIDPYPGISRKQIIDSGFKKPTLKLFQGAYGSTYYKLYQPFMSYKDEISIRTCRKHGYRTNDQLLKDILKIVNEESKATYSEEEYNHIIDIFKNKKANYMFELE